MWCQMKKMVAGLGIEPGTRGFSIKQSNICVILMINKSYAYGACNL